MARIDGLTVSEPERAAAEALAIPNYEVHFEQVRARVRYHGPTPLRLRRRQWSGHTIRFAQDCLVAYGERVRAFEIDELSPTDYRETEVDESPVLNPSGRGWNAAGMHHVDAHEQAPGCWIACVDGC